MNRTTSPPAPPSLDAAAVIEQALQTWTGQPGPLLPVLHEIQDRLGHIPPDAVPRIADALDLSRADIHGVLSFYHDFRTSPPGRQCLRICRAEACQAMGSEALLAHAKARLGIGLHQDSADGAYRLEAVYCLGNCALSPAVQIDGTLHGRVDAGRLDALLEGHE